MTEAALLARISDRSLRIVVIGGGYVGLPLSLAFARAGFETAVLDRDPARVAALRDGISQVTDVSPAELREALQAGRFRAESDPEVLASADAVVVCVPTPLVESRDPDVRHVLEAVEDIARHQHAGMLIVLESTSYPGTTRELVTSRLARGRFRLGESTFVAFSPERIDPGNPRYRLHNIPKVIGAACPASLRVASSLYETIVERLVPVSSTEAAETVKLLENTFRAVNVALVNEFALMSAELGVDIREVIEAAATKPFGYMPFHPGPGLGGHCVPVDPLYLSWRMRRVKRRARFVELADSINRSMPEHVVGRVIEALNEHARALRGASVLVYGIAYKRDVADTRESPGIAILVQLARRGAHVAYADPHVPRLRTPELSLESIPAGAGFGGYDAVVVATDHTALDRRRLLAEAPLIVDTRGALSGMASDSGRVYAL